MNGMMRPNNSLFQPRWMLLLLFIIQLFAIGTVTSKVRRAVVIVRVPRVGPFVKPDEDEEWTTALVSKLSEEETSSAIRVGRKLRELYIRATRLLPDEYRAEQLDIFSADSIRAAQTAQAIGVGLFEIDSSERVVDLIPIRRALKESDVLLQPCAAHGNDEENVETVVPKTNLENFQSFWSDFARFFRVHDDSKTEIGDWILESALATLLHSSPAMRDETLLARVRSMGRSMSGIKFRGSKSARLPHQILLGDVINKNNPRLNVYVVDSDEVMVSLIRAFTFLPPDAVTIGFPLPKSLVLELHDEDEIDPSSGITFVRVLQDFVPVTCSEQGEFYCEYEAFVQSAAPWMLSAQQFSLECRNTIRSSSGEQVNQAKVDQADNVPPSEAEGGAGGAFKLEPDSLVGRSDTDDARSTIIGQAHSSPNQPAAPCLQDANDGGEEFIHGFVVGCVLIASLLACRCRRKFPDDRRGSWPPATADHGTMDEMDDNERIRMEDQEGYGRHRPSGDLADSPDDDKFDLANVGRKALPSSGIASLGAAPSKSSVIVHIPRPKPTGVFGTSSSASNSPLISGSQQ